MRSGTSAICTLFEGHYHNGVAALTNSLYRQGYRGCIYAGYRGQLPHWTVNASANSSYSWQGSKVLNVADGLQLHFLPLDTEYHLTNYKPDFMIRVLNGPAKGAQRIFYFDPDIVITAPWKFFGEWVEYGVALCEDVNSPLSRNHPRRVAWRRYFANQGISLSFKDQAYVNGGYVGISIGQEGFLQTWRDIQEAMAPAIGGLMRSALNGHALPPEAQGAFAPFGKTDQDALNAAVEAWEGDLSLIGKEAMGLKSGTAMMPHALGQTKPWKWKPLTQVLLGRPPRLVDREYWNAAKGPIVSHSLALIHGRRVTIKIASFFGRFYKRGSN